MCIVSLAEGHRRARRDPPPVPARHRHRADLYELLGHRPRPTSSRATRRARSKARASPPCSTDAERARKRDAVLLDARQARASTTRAGWPTRSTRRSGRLGPLRERPWELYHLERGPRPDARPRRAGARSGSSSSRGLWFYCAGKLKGLPLDDRIAARDHHQGRGPNRRQAAQSLRVLPRPRRRARVGRRSTSAGARTPSPPRSRSPRTPQGVLFAQGGVGGRPLPVRQEGRLHYVYNWLGDAAARRSSPSARRAVGPARALGRVPEDGRRRATGSAIGTLTLYVDEDAVATGEIMTQPGFFALSGDGIRSAATAARPSRPPTTRPTPSAAAPSSAWSSTSAATSSSTTRRRSWPGSRAID